MPIHIRFIGERPSDLPTSENSSRTTALVSPGDVITTIPGFMRGHGTYDDDEDRLVASVAGFVEKVDRLISVRPLKTRYNGEVGDVVVGRITEVQQKKWKVDTCSRLESVLPLASVNLPGGQLRRKTVEDELTMRQYLTEGDLISAEVHSIYSDGSLVLHTRSMKYGKLYQGVLVKVSPSLIKRRKTHFHNLPCGTYIILGNNGYIWISPTAHEDTASVSGETGSVHKTEVISLADRETIARLRNCILTLASGRIMLHDTSILYAYEASLKHETKHISRPEVAREIVQAVLERMEIEGV